jgi:hypothetical protein
MGSACVVADNPGLGVVQGLHCDAYPSILIQATKRMVELSPQLADLIDGQAMSE